MKSILSLREDDTQNAKESLRRDMRRVRRALSDEERARGARAACAYLLALAEVQRLQRHAVVAIYAAIRTEIDPSHAARALAERGLELAYPRVVATSDDAAASERALHFHRVPELAELRPSPFGVPEPQAHHPRIPLDRIDLFVVPGLAFDGRGTRLGWGKGHYDITLARSRALRVGFAYRCQVIDEVPAADDDMPMDILVTDQGVSRISARARVHDVSVLPPHDP